MAAKKTPDDNLLDAQLDFIMNTPQEQFDDYLAESGANLDDINRKATLAFERALEIDVQAKQAAEALASIRPALQKTIADNLRIRRSVLAAFREHRVIVASIPQRFLARFAEQLDQTIEGLAAALAAPARRLAGQHKSDEKPDAVPVRVTFEQLLRDAAMSDEDIKELMRDVD
jgi:hypothetical protein